ncbi:MAG: MBL fold metallo-hydrolase [Hyphomonadaceae bacterium]
MSRRLVFTLLGTGSSGGVPRIGNDWGVCDPSEPRNRRGRCSALAELYAAPDSEPTRVLIDTAPDMREQLLREEIGRLDAVVFTHDHADQTGGIDDLRVLALRQRQRMPVHMDEPTASTLIRRVAYCFEGSGAYPSILDLQPWLEPLTVREIDGPAGELAILPIEQTHGNISSLGFRMGGLAYCNDLNAFPEESLNALEDLEVLIIDALRYTEHPSHANVEQAIAWVDALKPKRTVLTNMHIDLDYRTLERSLPTGVSPGYDGMRLEIPI